MNNNRYNDDINVIMFGGCIYDVIMYDGFVFKF